MSRKSDGKKFDINFSGFFFKSLRNVLIFEVGTICVSYLFWRRLNTNQDFRLYMYKNHNWILEGYYKGGEALSDSTALRDFDLNTWKNSGAI